MLIACDLDRTLIPNGDEVDEKTLPLFFDLVKRGVHTLVYVTGRDIGLVREAMKQYSLDVPDYLLGDVGTTMYKKVEREEGVVDLLPDVGWQEYIREKHPKWDWQKLRDAIAEDEYLYLQEEWRQNPFKLSFYLDLQTPNGVENRLARIKEMVQKEGVGATVVYSVDQIKKVGLVDILPTSATKVTALEYLMEKLGLTMSEVIYAGDSGNDILPITAGFRAILVKNARAEVREEVARIANEKGIEEKIYIAQGVENLNGNYSSGVLEGLIHFGVFPESDLLK